MIDDEFVDYLLDQLPNYSLHKYKMFGVSCLLYQQKIIAIIDDENNVFIKTSTQTLPTFIRYQGKQFTYNTKKGKRTMNFWSISELDVDNSQQLMQWIDLGIQAIQTK